MTADPGRLSVEVLAGPDTDAEELAQIAERLRAELLELDVEAVRPAGGGVAPADSKGTSWLAAGALVVQFVASHDVLASIISGVVSWLGRQRGRSIKLTLDGDTLELTGVNSAEQQRLTDLWVTRHAGAA